MSCFLFHSWSHWRPYPVKNHMIYLATGREYMEVSTRQVRTCLLCGKVDDEYVGPVLLPEYPPADA